MTGKRTCPFLSHLHSHVHIGLAIRRGSGLVGYFESDLGGAFFYGRIERRSGHQRTGLLLGHSSYSRHVTQVDHLKTRVCCAAENDSAPHNEKGQMHQATPP